MSSLKHFTETYLKLDRNHLDLLEHIYAEDIHFVDPAHELHGLPSLKKYFSTLYQNLSFIDFSFDKSFELGNQATITWTMRFCHPRLAKGRAISVCGCSWISFDDEGKVLYHRDYFDLGAMLYEQLPLLGRIVKQIKGRLGT